MQSQLIFDLKGAGYPWQYLAIGLFVATLMGLVAIFAKPRSELRLFCIACASLYALWMGVLLSTTYPAFSSLLDAELNGHFSIVEGNVTNFHRGGGLQQGALLR